MGIVSQDSSSAETQPKAGVVAHAQEAPQAFAEAVLEVDGY
jgi:hypothetical protein